MNQAPRLAGRPVRILFQKLTPATARKARAQSADARTGGGARDIRFGPYNQLQPFMNRFFTRGPERRRGRLVRMGTATWGDGRNEVQLEYWSPTDSRPNEGRIGKIPALGSLADPPPGDAEAVILFVQDEDDIIWARYSTPEGLRRSLPEVGDSIRDCIERTPVHRIAMGYIDLTDGGLGTWCRGGGGRDAQ